MPPSLLNPFSLRIVAYVRQHRDMCPKTASLVKALPRHHKHAFFSALAPGTHVVKHNGEKRATSRSKQTRHAMMMCAEIEPTMKASKTMAGIFCGAFVSTPSSPQDCFGDDVQLVLDSCINDRIAFGLRCLPNFLIIRFTQTLLLGSLDGLYLSAFGYLSVCSPGASRLSIRFPFICFLPSKHTAYS